MRLSLRGSIWDSSRNARATCPPQIEGLMVIVTLSGFGRLSGVGRDSAVQSGRVVGYRVARKLPVLEGRIWFGGCSMREAATFSSQFCVSLPGLKWPEAQQRQPMRIALAGHHSAATRRARP
jgi:hypothetical protein